jgi:hypothetical protein
MIDSPTETPLVLPRFSIEVFDFHLLRRRFLESEQDPPPRPKALAGPVAYGRAYWPTPTQEREAFDGFTQKSIGSHFYTNVFWRHYRKIGLEGKERSAWHRHLPLELEPKAKLDYTGARSATARSLEATVLLWPYGWSSSLKVSVEGALTREQVEALVEEIRSGNPFRVDGKAKSLGQTLQHLARDVEKAIGRSDAVESLSRSLTPALVWDKGADARSAQRSGWDPDWAYSRVLSRTSEQGKVRICTYLKDPDFAATLATRGTLLSLSCKEEGGPAEVECAVNNMRLFLRSAHVLLLFSQWGMSEAGRSPELDELVRTAQRLLRELPTYYKNPLCRQILERLPLARGRQPEGKENADGGKGKGSGEE